MIDGITIKKVAEDLRKLIDRVPDNAKPSDVRMLKAGYKNMIDIIEKIFSYEIHDKETGRQTSGAIVLGEATDR
jgi:hypothetical protein